VLATQHRVIGADNCHFSAPVTLAGEVTSSGRAFVTSARLVFAGPSVRSWPWHRVVRVVRSERTLTLAIAGAEPTALLCNSYGDALVIAAMAARLRR
jgi:hypothetical protein